MAVAAASWTAVLSRGESPLSTADGASDPTITELQKTGFRIAFAPRTSTSTIQPANRNTESHIHPPPFIRRFQDREINVEGLAGIGDRARRLARAGYLIEKSARLPDEEFVPFDIGC